jgi:lysophospholipase L1-like esterase
MYQRIPNADYRRNHGNAPVPEIPSRGLVVVHSDRTASRRNGNSNNTVPPTNRSLAQRRLTIHGGSFHPPPTKTEASPRTTDDADDDDTSREIPITSTEPLRILVIGDSLAAGVGTRWSSTPVLPESIAAALSQALGGRAVFWTCVGVPGQTSSEIVRDIIHLEDLLRVRNPTTPLLQRLDEWQTLQRQRAHDRIVAAKRKTHEWLEGRKEDPQDLPEELQQANRIVRWWKRTSMQLGRDIRSIRNIVRRDEEKELVRMEEGSEEVSTPEKTSLHSFIDPSVVGKYDIAIVLTGLNDLKESLLPFMMSPERVKELQQMKEQDEPSEEGMKGEFIRILQALEGHMHRILPGDDSKLDRSSSSENASNENSTTSSFRNKGPLIVFPALPYQPTVLSQKWPLSWFMIPLLNMVDRNKQMLSELYPGLVLFVESPDIQDWTNAKEAKKGTVWEDFQVLLKLNDIANDAKERIEQLMKRHYERWVCDDKSDTDHSNRCTLAKDHEDLYELDMYGDVSVRPPALARAGSIMVAADGIHPSDIGYDMWGRHIAGAIIREWEKRT